MVLVSTYSQLTVDRLLCLLALLSTPGKLLWNMKICTKGALIPPKQKREGDREKQKKRMEWRNKGYPNNVLTDLGH